MAAIKTREEAIAKVRDDLAHFDRWIKKRNAPVYIPPRRVVLIVHTSRKAKTEEAIRRRGYD